MRAVVDVVERARASNGGVVTRWERQDVAWRDRPDDLSLFSRGHGAGEPVRLSGRLAQAGVTEGLQIVDAQARVAAGAGAPRSPTCSRCKHTMRDLDLVTVCEEAGCPNIFECWADGTATFMINGERVHPGVRLLPRRHAPPAPARPGRAASASPRRSRGWACAHAVVTTVARDDLADGGATRLRGDDRRDPPRARRASRSRC